MKKWSKWHTIVALYIVLLLVISYIFLEPEQQSYPPFVSYSKEQHGTHAVYTWLEERGAKVGDWQKPWRFLPAGEGQALVVIEPAFEPEPEEIMDWVEQGNDVLLFDTAPVELPFLELVEARGTAGGTDGASILTDITIYGGERWDHLTSEEPPQAFIYTSYRLTAGDGDVLLADDRGALAARYGFGQGNMVVFLTPEWLTNELILEASHTELLWAFLREDYETIWFDEYHHGYQTAPGLRAVYPDWLLFVVAQLLAALFLWLWWRGKRFGPVYTPRGWIVRRGDESIIAVAGWYERRRLQAEAFRHQILYLRQLILEKWGLTTEASHDVLFTKAKQTLGEQGARKLFYVLDRDEQLRNHRREASPYSKKQFVTDCRAVRSVVQVLEKE